MIVKLLTEHHLECLLLKKGCTGSSESTHVKVTLLEITCTGSNDILAMIDGRIRDFIQVETRTVKL